ncbi:MAG: purine-nucleoside phosphorylase [Spirochaetota bacterium]
MPIHVKGKPEDIAKIVLLPGDPQRSEYIANKYFENPKKYTDYRLMYGFTGSCNGFPISVQTTGMGTPSLSIVVEELISLGAEVLIRVGTCGSINPKAKLIDVILATSASSSHDIFSRKFDGACYSASSDFLLNLAIYNSSKSNNKNLIFGDILTSETFYEENYDLYKKFGSYGTLAVEMESYALFGLAKKYGKKATALLTVSDLVFEQKRAENHLIQKGVDNMISLIIDSLPEIYRLIN